MDMKAPEGIATASFGQTVYQVMDGVARDVAPEHVAKLAEHGFTEFVAEDEKPRRGRPPLNKGE